MGIQVVFLDSPGHAGGELPISALTPREFEVASMVWEGKSTREIANTLLVEYETVRTHKNGIMRKLGVHTTARLQKFLMDTGIFSIKISNFRLGIC